MRRDYVPLMVLCLCMLFGFSSTAFSQAIGLEQAIREVCVKSDSSLLMRESVKKADEMVKEKWSNALPVVSANAVAAENYGSLFGGSSSSASTGTTNSMGSLSEGSQADQASAKLSKITATQDDINALLSSMQELGKPQTTTIYSTGISLSQPIFTFGKIGTAIKTAENFRQSANCTYARNMQTLQLAALDLFFRTLIADKSREISEHSLSRKKELYAFLDRNFRLGSGSKAQVLATKADVANQSGMTVIARRDALTIRMNLNMFMGRPLVDSTALDTAITAPALTAGPVPAAEEAVRSAIDKRTDLKSLKYLADATRGGAKIFKAMYLPSIGGTASLGYSKMQLNSNSSFMPTNGQTNWTVGIGAQWTLFDGFANRSRSRQYVSDANKLDIGCRGLAKVIEIEVRSAIAECTAADSNLLASEDMLGSAQTSYELTNNNFKQGSGQFADLQLSDELLRQAELGITNAKYRVIRSRAALRVAMGNDIVKIDQ
jgi:outer membrane protein